MKEENLPQPPSSSPEEEYMVMDHHKPVYFHIKIRFPIHFVTETTQHQKPFNATTTDISATGVGFITSHPLKPKEEIMLIFRLPGEFHSTKVIGTVLKQIPNPESSQSFLTQVQFVDVDDDFLDEVASFIVKKSSFLGLRQTVVILSFVAGSLTLLRLFLISVLRFLASTPAGKEWSLSVWSTPFWLSYEVFQFIFGIGLMISAAVFWRFNPWARKLLLGLSVLGILAQAARFFLKFSLLQGNMLAKSLYASEIIFLIIFLSIVWLIGQKKFAASFDSYLDHLQSHFKTS